MVTVYLFPASKDSPPGGVASVELFIRRGPSPPAPGCLSANANDLPLYPLHLYQLSALYVLYYILNALFFTLPYIPFLP